MQDSEKRSFSDLLEGHFTMHGIERPPAVMRRYWQHLSKYSLHDVTVALAKHEQDANAGKYFAKPADIIAILEAARPDGWPDADEAWSLAVQAADEWVSVVWTQEIATAWGESQPVMALGDEVGARMAFKSIYGRAVAMARAHSREPIWMKSLGRDPDGRNAAVIDAVNKGRLPPTALESVQALPAPNLKLLEGGAEKTASVDSKAALEAIKALKGAINGKA